MSAAETERAEDLRQRILEAAQRCFLRTGVHGTSMADVSRESGLAEHLITRHFGSRDDLVEGISANILRMICDFFEEIGWEYPIPPLDEVVERFAYTVIAMSEPGSQGRLTPIYWASALYSEEAAGQARAVIERIRSGWIGIAERERVAGLLPSHIDPEAVGATLVCLFPGILLQQVLFGDADPAAFRRGAMNLLGTHTRTPIIP